MFAGRVKIVKSLVLHLNILSPGICFASGSHYLTIWSPYVLVLLGLSSAVNAKPRRLLTYMYDSYWAHEQ